MNKGILQSGAGSHGLLDVVDDAAEAVDLGDGGVEAGPEVLLSVGLRVIGAHGEEEASEAGGAEVGGDVGPEEAAVLRAQVLIPRSMVS